VRILSSDHSNDDNNHVDATDDAFYGGTSLDTDVDNKIIPTTNLLPTRVVGGTTFLQAFVL